MNKLFVSIFLFVSALAAADIHPTLIGGTPADPAKWPFVIWLKLNGALCTGSVVGDRAVATAAHCAATGDKATFTIGTTTYNVTFTRHPSYPGKDWDISMGLTDQKIDTTPVSIGGQVAAGDKVHLMGFGCTTAGGGGGNDGILREGDAAVQQLATFDIVMKSTVALCFGDSGGPGFLVKDNAVTQVGINSKGNISDTSYDTKLWEADMQTFIKSWSTQNSADVCGVTKNCGAPPPPPPPKSFDLSNNVVSIHGNLNSNVDIEYVKNVMGDALRYLESTAHP